MDNSIPIPDALERAFARMSGITRQDIKFRIAEFLFRQKAWRPDQIKVFAGRTHIATIINHRFIPNPLTTASGPEVQREALRILENPKQAAIDHGKTSGACAICGRPLSDPASLLLGIGPICLNNFGWADDSIDLEDL